MEPKSNKSKTTIKVILGITALLAIVSIGIAYYYYQIQDVSPTNTSAVEGCGCYFIVSDTTINSCSTARPENAFEFRPGVMNSEGQCSATCDPRTASKISTSQTSPTILGCSVSPFPSNPGCIDIAIVNANDERLTEGINPEEPINLKATFSTPSNITDNDTDYYTDFSFLVNGEKITVLQEDIETTGTGGDKKYTVQTQFDDYQDNEKLTIQAFGTSVTSSEVTSAACLRTINVNQPKVNSCTSIDVSLDNDVKPKVEDLWLDLDLVEEPQSLAVRFTLGSDDTVITTSDITSQLIDGTLILDKAFLYDRDNFTSQNSFEILEQETSRYEIDAQVLVNGEEIDSELCKTVEDITNRQPSENPDPTDEDPDPTDEDPDPTDEDPDPTGQSSFMTSNTASRQCVERTAPNNTVQYTVSVRNTGDASQNIVSIKNKLPLGFTYTTGSTEINGVAVTDNEYVTITTVGSTQEIVWETEDGFSVGSGSSLNIVFRATANSSALTGSNLNEVVVTPANVPEDATTLRAEVAVQVAQSCTAPQTSIIDSNIAKALLGIILVGLAIAFYRSQFSNQYSEKVVGSDTYKDFKLFMLKLTQPAKHFEEKALVKLERKIRDRKKK